MEVSSIELPQGLRAEYNGRILDAIPDVVTDKKQYCSTAQIMEFRLKYGDEFPDLWKHDFYTSDLSVRNSRYFRELAHHTFFLFDKDGNLTTLGEKTAPQFKTINLLPEDSTYIGINGVERGARSGIHRILLPRKNSDHYDRNYGKGMNRLWHVLSRHPDHVQPAFVADKYLLYEYEKEVKRRTGSLGTIDINFGPLLEDTTYCTVWGIEGVDPENPEHKRSGMHGADSLCNHGIFLFIQK